MVYEKNYNASGLWSLYPNDDKTCRAYKTDAVCICIENDEEALHKQLYYRAIYPGKD
jgi:hypothetical protein